MSLTPAEAAALAQQRARELDFDRVVRLIAFSGTKDGAGISASRTFDGKDFDATSGAGTNSARVRIADNHSYHLYRADDYGRHIQIFREGAWVQRAIKEAARTTDGGSTTAGLGGRDAEPRPAKEG